MYKSQTLDNIRQNIDRIDNEVHDLLMERAALASSIAAEKKKRGMPVVHPAREARMIRRLLSRHKKPLPEMAVMRIWRELVSAVSMLQSGLSAQFVNYGDEVKNYKIILDYFGSLLPVTKAENTLNTLNSLNKGETDFVILPLQDAFLNDLIKFSLEDKDQDSSLSIVQMLPFIRSTKPEEDNQDFIVIMRAEFEPSDDDISYVCLSCENLDLIESHIEKLKTLGVDVSNTKALKIDSKHATLLTINGYVGADHKAFSSGNENMKIAHLGGHPKSIYIV